MIKLKDIPGFDDATLELLEIVGFSDANSLAKAELDPLIFELDRAAAILQLSSKPPTRDDVAKWIAVARNQQQLPVAALFEAKVAVNHELSPKVIEQLAASPFAIPLPAKFLIDQGLAVSDIPSGLFLNQSSGDLNIRVEKRMPGVKSALRAAKPTNSINLAESLPHRGQMDISRIKSIDALAGRAPRSEAPKEENDRLTLLRAPLAKTNLGRNPNSRFYIRGVMHTHPFSLRMGAIVTLILMLMLPVGIISSILLLLSQELPEKFAWVPNWLLVFPLSLPLIGLGYLIWGMKGSCRICGQRLFVFRMCLKNSRSHYIKGLGYVIPVSVHMLIFKWFRCTYCGTPVRLKK